MRTQPLATAGSFVAILATVLALIALTPQPASAAGFGTTVSLTFDDATADQVDAARVLSTRRLRGTFYVPSGFVGAPGFMTRANLQTLDAAGHEIGGHTVNHPDLGQVDAGEAQRQICIDRKNLESWGFRPVSFAYPFASNNPAIQEMARSCGYNTARSLGDVRSPNSCPGCVRAESTPPAAPYELRAADQVDGSWTLESLKNQVRQASFSGGGSGGWVVLTFHHICAPIGTSACPADRSVTPETFVSFVDWLRAYSSNPFNFTAVRTVDSAVRAYSGWWYPRYRPAQSRPLPVAVAPGENAIRNPSLEARVEETGFPQCFQPSGYGQSTRRWSDVRPGRTGEHAQQVTVTGYVDGDSKLLPAMDLGQCTPTVRPGVSYDVTVHRIGTGRSQVALYYRDAAGAWFYWTSGPWLDPAQDWTPTTYRTPPVPVNATGLSVGVAQISDGTLLTDDYDLRPAGAQPPQAAAEPPQAAQRRAARAEVLEQQAELVTVPGADGATPGSQVAPPVELSAR